MEEHFNYKEFKFLVCKDVYHPGEDSFLLLKEVLKLEGSLLEIGSGTGFISIVYEREKNKEGKSYVVEGVDKSREAVECSLKNAKLNSSKATFYYSDMFSNVGKSYDYVVFNPPYLGREEEREGREDYLYDKGQIYEFLSKVERYAEKGYLIVLSSENENYSKYREVLEERKAKRMAKERYFFEDLEVYKVERKEENF